MTTKTKLIAAALASMIAAPAFAGSPAAPIMEAPVEAPAYLAPLEMPVAVTTVANGWAGFYAGADIVSSETKGLTGDGTNVGLHVGYNHALTEKVVVGAEMTYGLGETDLDAGGEFKNGLGLAAKVGYDAGKFMPYATVGIKEGKATVGGVEAKETGTMMGLGVDYKLSEQVILGGALTTTNYGSMGGSTADVKQTNLGAKVSFKF